MGLQFWASLAIVGWALLVTVCLFYRNPLPFPDRGHRLFGVPDEKARTTVLNLLQRAGMDARFRFKSGSSDQTVLWDNMTVIHLLQQQSSTASTGNGISVVVSDPESAAEQAINLLHDAGYQAEGLSLVSDFRSNDLVVINSDAFLGWALVFRRHQLRMPKPTFISIL